MIFPGFSSNIHQISTSQLTRLSMLCPVPGSLSLPSHKWENIDGWSEMSSGRGPGSKWTLSVYTLIDSANRLVWPRVAKLLKSLIPASSPCVLSECWLSWWDESSSVTVTSPGSNTQYCTGHLFNWATPLHITPGVMDHDGPIISLHFRLEIKWGCCSWENKHCW